jgi:tRNA pseudouridine13 synthase
MKLKSEADDFQVEELTSHKVSSGTFSLYRLSKEHIGTLEAIQAIAQAWRLDSRDIAFGGLKDKHAKTVQYLTIQHGPTENLEQKSFALEFLGHSSRAYTAQDIQGNRFAIRLRAIPVPMKGALEKILRDPALGVPNYFDDQRFGSLGESQQFCAEPWCRGDYERALWLALADFNPHDRPRERQQKQLLQEHWGDWAWLVRHLDRSHRRDAADILDRHPRDFRVALTVIRHDLRGLYLAAFQSHLWNELLAAWIEQLAGPDLIRIKGTAGELVFPPKIDSALLQTLSSTEIPLPSARITEWPPTFEPLIQSIMARYGMTPKQIRVKYPRDTFFSKGERVALTKIQGLEHNWESVSPSDIASSVAPMSTEETEDLILKFTLPRGSYATMLIRWLKTSMNP